MTFVAAARAAPQAARAGCPERASTHRALALVIALLLVAPSVPGATARLTRATQSHALTPEYEVKAAFLYNLAAFVEWPDGAFATPDAPIVLGITGPDPFGGRIDTLVSGRKVRGRPVVVKRIEWGAALRECHLLFVSAGQADRLPDLVRLLEGAPVLTVGDDPRSARRGCVVAFVVSENKVGLEVNVDRAARAQLNISSKLLSLARIRRDESGA